MSIRNLKGGSKKPWLCECNPQGRKSSLSISSNNGDIAWLKSIFNKLIKFKEWKLPNPVDGVEPIKRAESEVTF